MPIPEDPAKLFRIGNAYRSAAEQLRSDSNYLRGPFKETVVRFLFAHATEMYLKAYLAHFGKEKMVHDLPALLKMQRRSG